MVFNLFVTADPTQSVRWLTSTQRSVLLEAHPRNISGGNYQYVQRVWNEFGCRTLGDYHDPFLRTDVLLLADVFETFGATSLKHYNLDPANYFSLLGMDWDALLKKTKIEQNFSPIQTHVCIGEKF